MISNHESKPFRNSSIVVITTSATGSIYEKIVASSNHCSSMETIASEDQGITEAVAFGLREAIHVVD